MAERKPLYEPYLVFTNVLRFIESSRLKLNAEALFAPPDKITEATFVKHIQAAGYVMLQCIDGPDRGRRFRREVSAANRAKPVHTAIVILDLESDYLRTSPDIVKLINLIPGANKRNNEHNIVGMLIVHEIPNVYIRNKVIEFNHNGNDVLGFVNITFYLNERFYAEMTKHVLCPKHRVLNEEEEKRLLQELEVTKLELPKILATDAIALWIGADLGNIIEVDSFTEGYPEKKYLAVRI